MGSTMHAVDNSPEATTGYFRMLRRRSGLTLAALASAMGYRGASSIQRYEDAKSYRSGYPSDEFVRKLEIGLVGRGKPAITSEDVYAIGGPRYAKVRAGVEGTDSEKWPNLVQVHISQSGGLIADDRWRLPLAAQELLLKSSSTCRALVAVTNATANDILFVDRELTLMNKPGSYAVADHASPGGVRIEEVGDGQVPGQLLRTNVLGRVIARFQVV